MPNDTPINPLESPLSPQIDFHAAASRADPALISTDSGLLAQGIVESIADPMVVYDDQWRVRYENAAAVSLFLASDRRTSMLGRTLWMEYPDLIGTAFEHEMKGVMRTRRPSTFIERRNSVWTEVRCYPLSDGGVAVVWRNITDQKRAEQTLRYLSRASEVLSNSLDYDETTNALVQLVVPDLADWCSISLLEEGTIRLTAVAHVDPDKVKLVRDLDAKYPSNPDARTRTAEVIRTGKAEIIPLITEDMIDRAVEDPDYRALLKTLAFSSVITVPLAVRGHILGAMSLVAIGAESRRQFDDHDMALAEELGRRAAIAVENALLYREAIAAKRAAEAANATKTAFLTRMSHELRTPLNAIGGYTELLTMGIRGPISSEQRRDLDAIGRSQQHLLSLINDVLNYAKVEAGRLQYDIAPVCLADALAEIERLFEPLFREKVIDYRLEPVNANLLVSADADKLQQILLNLVSNAVKFTPGGGRITITARTHDEIVEIQVSDTGIGVSEDKAEIIFEPFVQVPRNGVVAQGTGLGLAISRDLARGMQGEISVASAGVGSTFILSLQRAG